VVGKINPDMPKAKRILDGIQDKVVVCLLILMGVFLIRLKTSKKPYEVVC